MWGIATWLSNHDEFGTWAKFNYRGESGYGTGWGGFCSLLITLMTAGFTIVQLYGFCFDPSFNTSETTYFLATNIDEDVEPYTLKTGDLVPTFFIKTTLEN